MRVPPWCMAIHDEESAPRARAWVYLLGAWHNGDDPSTREVRRVTGFGQGRADALVRDVAAWAVENGARLPARVAEQHRSRSGAASEQRGTRSTPESRDNRSGVGAASEQERSVSRARVPLVEREEDQRETEGGARAEPPPAKAVEPRRIPEPDTFADPADVVLDSGNEIPGRLSDLLAEMHEMSPQRVIARLLMVPVESTRALLELSRGQWYGAEGRCYVTGCASLRGPLDRYLQQRWGVGLGALATTHEAPRHTRTGPSFASVLDELGEGPPRRNAIDAEVLR